MKILFSDITYSYLFPGGKQVHADKLFSTLNSRGVEVEYENWHNPTICGEIVHFFGFNDFNKIIALKKRGYKLVYTHIMDGLTNQSDTRLRYHLLKNIFIKILPEKFNALFPWRALKYFDAIIYMHKNDRDTAIKLYNLDPNKCYIIPHAVDTLDKFKGGGIYNNENNKYLVSVGSIVERKNTLFLADLCIKNKIPIVFIGHPFDKNSNYYVEFLKRVDGKYITYLGFVSEETKIEKLKNACGFVLLSFGESGCISIYEAGATGLPLLLSDLPWAKGYENPTDIKFCSPTNNLTGGKSLIDFYLNSVRRDSPSFKVNTWKEIAEMYVDVYHKVLNIKTEI